MINLLFVVLLGSAVSSLSVVDGDNAAVADPCSDYSHRDCVYCIETSYDERGLYCGFCASNGGCYEGSPYGAFYAHSCSYRTNRLAEPVPANWSFSVSACDDRGGRAGSPFSSTSTRMMLYYFYRIGIPVLLAVGVLVASFYSVRAIDRRANGKEVKETHREKEYLTVKANAAANVMEAERANQGQLARTHVDSVGGPQLARKPSGTGTARSTELEEFPASKSAFQAEPGQRQQLVSTERYALKRKGSFVERGSIKEENQGQGQHRSLFRPGSQHSMGSGYGLDFQNESAISIEEEDMTKEEREEWEREKERRAEEEEQRMNEYLAQARATRAHDEDSFERRSPNHTEEYVNQSQYAMGGTGKEMVEESREKSALAHEEETTMSQHPVADEHGEEEEASHRRSMDYAAASAAWKPVLASRAGRTGRGPLMNVKGKLPKGSLSSLPYSPQAPGTMRTRMTSYSDADDKQ